VHERHEYPLEWSVSTRLVVRSGDLLTRLFGIADGSA